jgi:hypothetical protein
MRDFFRDTIRYTSWQDIAAILALLTFWGGGALLIEGITR